MFRIHHGGKRGHIVKQQIYQKRERRGNDPQARGRAMGGPLFCRLQPQNRQADPAIRLRRHPEGGPAEADGHHGRDRRRDISGAGQRNRSGMAQAVADDLCGAVRKALHL